jgi:hypothetical protein
MKYSQSGTSPKRLAGGKRFEVSPTRTPGSEQNARIVWPNNAKWKSSRNRPAGPVKRSRIEQKNNVDSSTLAVAVLYIERQQNASGATSQ